MTAAGMRTDFFTLLPATAPPLNNLRIYQLFTEYG
jgi:hypothetical protein